MLFKVKAEKENEVLIKKGNKQLLEKGNFSDQSQFFLSYVQNFKHLIHQQLTVNLEKIFHNSMFGHRKCHGCLMALHAFTEQWKEDLDNHNIIGTIAIDLSKAFDCVPHDIILEKLKFYGLSDHQNEVHHVSVLRATLFKIFKMIWHMQ